MHRVEAMSLEIDPDEAVHNKSSFLDVVRNWRTDLRNNGLFACLQHNSLFVGLVAAVVFYFIIGCCYYSTVEDVMPTKDVYQALTLLCSGQYSRVCTLF